MEPPGDIFKGMAVVENGKTLIKQNLTVKAWPYYLDIITTHPNNKERKYRKSERGPVEAQEPRMCYRKYYKYKCCAVEKDVDWVACEDRPPGMNCPKAQEHNWQGPYAQYLGEIEGPCWNCMWASYNDGGKAKREFIANFGKRKPGEQPWESDEERKDQRMAGEDWYWAMRRRQKKQREKERRKLETEAGRVTHSTVQWPEGVEGEGTSGSSTPGTSGSRPDSLPESQHASRPSSRYAFSVAGAQTPSRQLPN